MKCVCAQSREDTPGIRGEVSCGNSWALAALAATRNGDIKSESVL